MAASISGKLSDLSEQPAKRPTEASPLLRASLVALAALLMVTAGGFARAPDVTMAAGPHRVGRFKLSDICPDGLPWTAEPRLSLPARLPRDKNDVPMIIRNGQRYYWPGALAINSMKRLDAYADTGDRRQLDQALKQAAQLRRMTLMRRNAAWIPYWYDYPPAGQRAPWFDAMTQGLTLSLYVRLYRATGNQTHLRAANKVFRSFLRLGQNRGPWVAYADADRNLWLEHYPMKRPDHVLNAHMHAIIGLYEYWQLTRSPKARHVLKGAIATMRRNAQRYRRPTKLSYYGLRIKSVHRKYHNIHVWQFRLLANISGDEYFDRLFRSLRVDSPPRGYVPGRPAKPGPRSVSPECRPDAVVTSDQAPSATLEPAVAGLLRAPGVPSRRSGAERSWDDQRAADRAR